MLTAGTFDIFRYHLTADFYDAQAHALLGGHLALPPGLLGIEAFDVGGKQYMYQGPTPAFLRIPVDVFTHSLDGRLATLSMLLAFVVAAAAIGWIAWQVRGLVRGAAPVSRGEALAVAGFMFVATGGSVVLFTAGQVSVYHESALWGAALTLAALATILRYLVRPRLGLLALASLLVLLALWSRASVGLGGAATLAVVVAAEGIAWLRARFGRRDWRWTDPLRPPGTASWRRLLALGAALAVPVVFYVALNEVKFHSLFSVPWDQQEYARLSASRREFLAQNDNSFFGFQYIPTTVAEYLRPDGLTFQRAFPWVGFRSDLLGHADGYFGVRFDKIDVTGSVPVSFPLLTVLGIVGLWAVVVARRRAPPLARLWPPLIGAAVGGLTIFVFGFVAERYLSDLFPLLVIAGAAGFAVLTVALGRARGWRWRKLAIGALVVLGVLGTWVTFAQTLWFQRVFASPPDEASTQAFIRFQQDLGSHYTDGSLLRVSQGDRLPRRGKPGELFVVGNCAGLYVSDGSAVDSVQPTNWKPVQRTTGVGVHDVTITFPDRAPGTTEPLLAGGTPERPQVVSVQYLGDDMAVFAYRDGNQLLVGQPVHVTPGKEYRAQLAADPQSRQVSVLLGDHMVLLVPYDSQALLHLGVNDVDSSTSPRFTGTIVSHPETNGLCRSVLERAGVGSAQAADAHRRG
jgi:hypothetical protein